MKKDYLKLIIKNFLIYSISFLIIGSLVYWLWKNPIYNPVGPRIQTFQSNIEVRFKNAEVRGRKNGIPYWIAKSKLVESEKNSSIIYFKNNPEGIFFNLKDWNKSDFKDGIVQENEELRQFSWKGKEAHYNTDTEDFSLIENVKIITDKKDIIETDELIWDNYEKTATSNKRTKITHHKGYPIISSNSVKANTKNDVIDFKGNVELITELSNDEQL
jgi:LPS export ABC transporter protein LptC